MIQHAFVRLIEFTSTSSQHVMRSLSVLATQHCIIERKFSKSGAGYQVEFADIREKLSTFAPTMLSPVKGNGNTYSYAQANAWSNKNSVDYFLPPQLYLAARMYIARPSSLA